MKNLRLCCKKLFTSIPSKSAITTSGSGGGGGVSSDFFTIPVFPAQYWIDVDVGVPVVCGDYLIIFKYTFGGTYVRMAEWTGTQEKHQWRVPVWYPESDTGDDITEHVIAWMPLPAINIGCK